MLLFFLNGIGRFLAWTPEWVARGIGALLGYFVYYCLPSRRRLILSNLSHAFPEKPLSALKAMARESCKRTMEMGLFALASPFFSNERIRSHFSIVSDEHSRTLILEADERSVIALVPHFAAMESITMLPAIWNLPIPPTGVIYRPFKNKHLETYIKATRERFGLQLLSRKQGFQRAIDILRKRGSVAILFDQNAGNHGVLSTFMGRIASTSELPGVLLEKFDAKLIAIYAQRTGFWRAELQIEALECPPDKTHVTLTANAWLENKLYSDTHLTADWLWLHSRWRTQDAPDKRFRLEMKRSILPETLAFYNKETLDPTYRLWVRLPNWLGDVVMALPLLRALKEGRPDAELTLIGHAPVLTLLETLGIGDRHVPLPQRGLTYFSQFLSLRNAYPDTHVLFTNSIRGDIEARILGAPQRFGMRRPGKKRPLLTHCWDLPKTLDERTTHQTRVWEAYLQHFGLRAPLDLSPFQLDAEVLLPKQCAIGIIAGTENNPEKRWPISHWNTLLDAINSDYPKAHCYLFGTARDAAITRELSRGRNPETLHDLAGTTSLIAFAKKIAACNVVICNDTGGMHLANALGVPVIALYGPTNPVRTGPIFNAPQTRLQPKECPETGGAPISRITPETVLEALTAYITH